MGGSDSYRVAKHSRTTESKKRRNTKLLSGHTNVDNKTLSFAYRHMQITTTAGAPWTYTYRANSPYDPDPALGGTEAYGFSTMAARYTKYYVKSSRIHLLASGYNNTKIEPLVLLWADQKANHTLLDISTAIGICKANGGVVQQMSHVLAQAKSMKSVSMKTKDLFRGGIGDEDNSSAINNNPANESYFHIAIYPISTSDLDSGMDANILVGIDYDVMFYDPKEAF